MLSQYKQNQFDFCFFFFNDTATTEIYTLSLHDALPISPEIRQLIVIVPALPSAYSTRRTASPAVLPGMFGLDADRKSTRLNSSHSQISYAVFCLKKKKNAYHFSYSSIALAQPTES